MMIKKGSLVHLRWMDAEATAEWTEEAELHDHSTLECETAGFLVTGPTKKSPVYVIAATRSKDNNGKHEYNAIQKIPSAWVTEVKEI